MESMEAELVFDAGEARTRVGDFRSWQLLKHSVLVPEDF